MGLILIILSLLMQLRAYGSLNLKLDPRKITPVKIFGRKVFLKRDDIMHDPVTFINGNKGRKLSYLSDILHSGIAPMSYGGYQSNSMLAISRIAAAKGCKFHYLTTSIPTNIKSNIIGNLKDALNLGTNIIEVKDYKKFKEMVKWSEQGADSTKQSEVLKTCGVEESLLNENVMWVRQGGSIPSAAGGISKLGQEIDEFITSSDLPGPWKVVVASGTGTTAYFLAQYFVNHYNHQEEVENHLDTRESLRVDVLAVPCVSTAEHLREQMLALHKLCQSNSSILPTILHTHTVPKRPFAKPCIEHCSIWNALRKQTGIEFDLIYAPRVFEILATLTGNSMTVANWDKSLSLQSLYPEANIIYYHCGGVEGNESQLARYTRLGIGNEITE